MNMIDSHFMAALNITPVHKSHAIKYTMANSETNASGTVTHDVTMELKIGPHQELLTLNITKLHSYAIMLSIPWLKLHTPGFNGHSIISHLIHPFVSPTANSMMPTLPPHS